MLKLVKCPETGMPELVECVETPLGHLLYRCTHFQPTCAMKCTRGCAVALDREVVPGPSEESKPTLDLDLEGTEER